MTLSIRNKQSNIIILTYWSYSDALIQTYTLPYVRIIRSKVGSDCKIFLQTLEKNVSSLSGETAESIRIKLMDEGIIWIPMRYTPFGFLAFVRWGIKLIGLTRLIITQRISVIHCWCTPAGAIGSLLSMLTNTKLIIDSFEPHAEPMVESGTWSRNGIAFKLLFWFEKMQARKAAYLIPVTEGMQHYAKVKYDTAVPSNLAKPACVDLNLFSAAKVKDPATVQVLGFQNKIVCVYAGKFGDLYYDVEVFLFFKAAYAIWGDTFRVLLLTSHSQKEIDDLCAKAGIDPFFITVKFVEHSLVPLYMGVADFAITPLKPIPSRRYCTPIKNGEYWAMGLPVVIPPGISDDSDIIERNNIGVVLREQNEESYTAAIRKIDTLIKDPLLREKIRRIAVQYRGFQIADRVYSTIYHKA